MATINLVIPPIDADTFSGGILCLLEYAKGLRSRGHFVNIVPLLPSPRPRWFAGDIGWFPDEQLPAKLAESLRAIDLGSLPLPLQMGLFLVYTRELLQNRLPPADVTVATACITALPVRLYGTGRRYYFVQHFEPYFGIDLDDPTWFEHEARASYRLNLELIANSSWLVNKLREETGAEAQLCNNAIDHSVFFGSPKTGYLHEEVRIISYGGRSARWKGFMEMAAAVRLARARLPHIKVQWQVYGTSALEPCNSIADYEPLGFLQSKDLAVAYNRADILLSASWYESFPLFPLEAMACGLPVITTKLGTEDFAVPEVTAEVVEARDPESIACGLVRMVTDHAYRSSLAERGHEISKGFTWDASVTRMEGILLGSNSVSMPRAASGELATQALPAIGRV